MYRFPLTLILCGLLARAAFAQEQELRESPQESKLLVVDKGTHIPLSLINSVSTKHSAEGDRVYLETVFPILAAGKIVIPPGSFVSGTITEVKRPGRVKGRGELYLRFDSLTLTNGVTRDFRARVGGIDGRGAEELDRKEGKIISEGNKAGDVKTIGETIAAGASIGVVAGAAGKSAAMGAGVGAVAGAAAGIAEVLLTRGPDAILAKGSTIEMVLDRPISFSVDEIPAGMPGPAGHYSNGGDGPAPSVKHAPRRGFPL
jgi:type IV secretion system protein VirB10